MDTRHRLRPGAQHSPVGPLVVDPHRTGHLYTVTGDGVLTSDDDGGSRIVTPVLPPAAPVMLVPDPTDPATLYVGTSFN